jgi:signal transduction histidine kinase
MMTKILVIEDDASLRQEILDWLTFEGYETIGAADGIEGVNCAIMHIPDLILCDISMPRFDGYGVLLEVNANSVLQSTPFIFLSAKAEREDVRKGMHLGADDYLTKPFTQHELLEAIRARFEKKAVQNSEYQQQIDIFKQALDAEHQERLLQGKLVGMFSHDFRNQLAVIKSGATLVRDYAPRLSEERRQKWMDKIMTTTNLLDTMLDDLLDLAQMQTGNFVVRQEPLNMTQFIQSIVDEFQNGLGQRHNIRMTSVLSITVLSDERLLRQISANLISNAIKYSPAGSEIDVSLDHIDAQYTLTVSDHGIGIQESDKHRLFEAFQRGSNVGKVTGTGLGLAVAKNAVDLLNGTIDVHSMENVGTTFIVSLPVTV